MNEGMRLRARVLLRARWRAVVAIGVIAGLLGGGLIALATAARETDRSLETYMGRLDAPDAVAAFCASDDHEPADDVDPSNDCFTHDQRDALDRLRSDPRVVAAGRVSPTPVLMQHGSDQWLPMFAYVAMDGLTGFGRPPVIDGVPADPDDPGQVMVNETLARQHGVTVGDLLEIAPVTWEQQFAADQIPDQAAAPAVPARVTAILRTPDDLRADEAPQLQITESTLFLAPGWVHAVGENAFARYSTVVGMQLQPAADPEQVIDGAAAGRPFSVVGPMWDVRAISEAIRYDARAAYAATAIAVGAAVVFLAQLVARQARRELDDAEPLRALGATRALVVQSVVPRWVASCAIATAVALPLAMLLRPLGPIGLGRRLVDSAGMSLDPVVAVPAVVLLVALLLGAGAATTWMAAGPARTPARVNRRPLPVGASPTAATGLALGFSGWSRRWTVTTVLAVAATVAAAIGAVIVLASLRQLTSEPARFGATWDMSAAALLGPDSAETLVQALGELPGVEAAAGLLGNDARIGDDLLYTYAFAPLDGLPEGIGPVISRGRAPSTPGEVALGALSMERAGVDIGDSVPLSYLDHTADLEVVGEAVINDGYEDIPGTGAIVHHEWLQSVDPDNWATDVVVRFEPEAREVGVAAMEAAFPQTASSPLVHAGIRDLQRIDSWLVALSGFAAALAAATFAHALSVTVRRQQRQLGVLRALGFARRQVRASVAWLASLVAVVAVVIGVPVGAAIGRWGWGRFAHNLGIPSVPVVPLVTMALVALAALVVANVIAFPLAWRAARGRPADALRAE